MMWRGQHHWKRTDLHFLCTGGVLCPSGPRGESPGLVRRQNGAGGGPGQSLRGVSMAKAKQGRLNSLVLARSNNPSSPGSLGHPGCLYLPDWV